jgi:hypothetical protein
MLSSRGEKPEAPRPQSASAVASSKRRLQMQQQLRASTHGPGSKSPAVFMSPHLHAKWPATFRGQGGARGGAVGAGGVPGRGDGRGQGRTAVVHEQRAGLSSAQQSYL